MSQYSDDGEKGVSPVTEVVERVGLLFPRSIPIFQNPANISGKNQVTILANAL